MNYLKRIAVACLTLGSLLLVGCATAPSVVTKTEIVFLTPPENLLKDCKVASPPRKKAYLDSDYEGKEDLLIEFGRAQTTAVAGCNKDKQSLRIWVEREKENRLKAEREKNATK